MSVKRRIPRGHLQNVLSSLKKSQKMCQFWSKGWKGVFQEDIFNWLLAGLKSLRKCANSGLQWSVIDGLLAGLKSRWKCANFVLQVSVIDRLWRWKDVFRGDIFNWLLAGLKSRRNVRILAYRDQLLIGFECEKVYSKGTFSTGS